MEGGKAKGPYLYILISIIIGQHMKMFSFKFKQNCTMNEKFDYMVTVEHFAFTQKLQIYSNTM